MKNVVHTLSESKRLRQAFEVIFDTVKYAGNEATMLKAFNEYEPRIVFVENRDYNKKQLSSRSCVFMLHHYLIEAEIIFTDDVAESARMFVSKGAFNDLRHNIKLNYVDNNNNEQETRYTWKKSAFGLIQELHVKGVDAKVSFIHVPFSDHKIIFSGMMEIVNKVMTKHVQKTH